jgi:hypothetical protein
MAAQGSGTSAEVMNAALALNEREAEGSRGADSCSWGDQRVGGQTGGGSLTAAYHAGSGHCG